MAKKKEKEIKLEDGQVVEVEYDKALVQEFIDHKEDVVEGIGADGDDVPTYGLQTTVNTDDFDELLGEGAVVLDE